MVLIRTALMDFLAVRGDRLVGKETLVVLVGEARAARYVSGILMILVLSLMAGPAAGLSTSFSYVAVGFSLVYGWFLTICVKSRFKEASLFEGMIESVLIAFGFIALIWNVLV